MIARAAVGFAAAVMVAEAGRRAGGLTQRGALAAVLVGTAAMAAGLAWGATLVVFFVAGTALSRLGAATKAQRTRAVLGTSGARDAGQVLANGGVFAGCALVWAQLDAPWVAAAALGALCGAFGDTAATEIGTWLGGAPRSIVTGRRVAPGMSGGVTLAGSVAAVVACTMDLSQLINLSDGLIFLMAIPNLIGVYLLLPVVREEVDGYFAKLKSGEIRPTAG